MFNIHKNAYFEIRSDYKYILIYILMLCSLNENTCLLNECVYRLCVRYKHVDSNVLFNTLLYS